MPLLSATLTHGAEQDTRPNILIILADDLGYSDLGCYGGEIRTPNLDSLASAGLRLTRCYNSSRCCPSRASLLTGLYPHQAGIGNFVGNGTRPGYEGRLTERCTTLAEVLKPAGYATYAAGKWHVNDPPPTERGFQEFYGFVHGYAVDSWDPSMMVRLPEGSDEITYPEGEYFATDAITDHALQFLDMARKTDKPWLLYTAYQAPHFPIQAPPSLSATYIDTYEKGWDQLRSERLERMKKLGLCEDSMKLPPLSPIDNLKVAKAHGSLTEDGNNPKWNTLPNDRRADLTRRMAVYAAMVEGMDSNIGRIIKSLRKHDELDNTLIIFLSDNGACAEWEPYGFDLKPFKSKQKGRGINMGTPNKPNHLHKGDDELNNMGGPGSLFSYGSAWANLSNTPLSLYKHYANEGGIRTPMIIHWPKRIKEPGTLKSDVSHIMDIMATCIDVSGARYPDKESNPEILPIEGMSLLPVFDGDRLGNRSIISTHEGNIALIEGDWKLVAQEAISGGVFKKDITWKLHHLPSDPAELIDLSEKEPERRTRMLAKLEDEAKRTMVIPSTD